MAVLKVKAYRTKQATENAIRYTIDKILQLDKTIEYTINGRKTVMDTGTELVSGINCKPSIAIDMFARTADNYYRNGHMENVGKSYKVPTLLRARLNSDGEPVIDINGNFIHDENAPVYHDENGDTITFLQERKNQARLCYMWVMAFPPPDSILMKGKKIDPALCHQIGNEWCELLQQEMGLEFPFVIGTHMDKHHIHNHIMQSAFAMDGHHKYRDTMDNLRIMREISDRLSLKYDIPIILEPENGRSIGEKEWAIKVEGKSWKEIIRRDIQENLSKSKSYQDYIKRMRESGYTMRETDNNITYYTPDLDHRCRDIGLGNEYTKSEIMKYFGENPVINNDSDIGQETNQGINQNKNILDSIPVDVIKSIDGKKPIKIFVDRYTPSGRRRTDLEMLFLKAIAILKSLKDVFHEPDNTSKNPVLKSYEWKIERLREAIEILGTYEIKNIDDLKQKLTESGIALSQAQAEYKNLFGEAKGLRELKDMLANAADLKNFVSKFGITDYFITPADHDKIYQNRAKMFPSTAQQKREFYIKLNDNPLYCSTEKFNALSYRQMQDAIDFLSGKLSDCPSALTDIISYEKLKNERYYYSIAQKIKSALYNKLKNKPVSNTIKNELSALHINTTDGITLPDALHIIACAKPWNPNYTESATDLPSAKQKQISDLLEMRGLSLNIPVQKLSETDATKIIRELSLSLLTPDALQNQNDISFDELISGMSMSYDDRKYVTQYRNLLQQLSDLGFDPNNIENALSVIDSQIDALTLSKKQFMDCKQDYAALAQLKQYCGLANNKKFTHGNKWIGQEQIEQTSNEMPISDVKNENQNPEPERKRRKFNDEIDF